MPLYQYAAINETGQTVKGTINAVNDIDLETRLKGIGLDLVENKEVTKKVPFFAKRRITNKDLILLCIHMEQLDRAGVPILDSLSDLRDSSDNPGMKNLMADLFETVRNGKMLSAALMTHPKVFDDIFVGLIEAGEKTGQISEVLNHLGNHIKWGEALKKKIKKATTYPIFLLIVMCGVVSIMMIYVVPKLSKFLTSQGIDLPFSTTSLIATSNAFSDYWYLIFGIPIVLIFIIKILNRTSEAFAYKFDALTLYVPVIGSTVRKIEIARFCRFFSITYKSGIGILECLEISSGVILNRIVKESVVRARQSVFDGSTLTSALRNGGQFPSLVIRMFKVGEDSGNLDSSLETVNFFYDKEVDESVEKMIGMIQPTLTIVLGVILGWIVIAVFGPLYGSFSKLGG